MSATETRRYRVTVALKGGGTKVLTIEATSERSALAQVVGANLAAGEVLSVERVQ